MESLWPGGEGMRRTSPLKQEEKKKKKEKNSKNTGKAGVQERCCKIPKGIRPEILEILAEGKTGSRRSNT